VLFLASVKAEFLPCPSEYVVCEMEQQALNESAGHKAVALMKVANFLDLPVLLEATCACLAALTINEMKR
jgi:hypothetical protein